MSETTANTLILAVLMLLAWALGAAQSALAFVPVALMAVVFFRMLAAAFRERE